MKAEALRQDDADGVKELVQLFIAKQKGRALSDTLSEMIQTRIQAEQQLQRTELDLYTMQQEFVTKSSAGAALLQTWPLVAQHIRSTAPSSWDLSQFTSDEALLQNLRSRLPWLQNLPVGDASLKEFQKLLFSSAPMANLLDVSDEAPTEASTPDRCDV